MGRVAIQAGALALLGVLIGGGCRSPLVASGDGYRHRRHHYAIGVPNGPGAPWQRFEVEGAVLAFRRAHAESVSLQSRCGRAVADPAVMARHLTIGVPDLTLLSSGPVQVADRSGWTQTFDTRKEGIPVRIKTVTLVAADCTFDWVLVTPGDFVPAETDFDAWWDGFRLGPEYDEAPPR
jgi:hypothetical protein